MWGRHMAMKALKRWSTEELERALHSDNLNKMEKYEAERILRDRTERPSGSSHAAHTMLLDGLRRTRWAPLLLPSPKTLYRALSDGAEAEKAIPSLQPGLQFVGLHLAAHVGRSVFRPARSRLVAGAS